MKINNAEVLSNVYDIIDLIQCQMNKVINSNISLTVDLKLLLLEWRKSLIDTMNILEMEIDQ